MISEVSFAKKFTAFWNQLIPGCDSYVRLINQGLLQRTDVPIDLNERVVNRAIVNGVAFKLFCKIVERKIRSDEVNEYLIDKQQSNDLIGGEIEFLSRFSHRSQPEVPLTEDEVKSILLITQRLYRRYKNCASIKVFPLFSGCGILNPAQGDILIDETLVEIKAGDRSFSVYDIRQLLIYCAMNYKSGERIVINAIELFNPRVGIVFNEHINKLTMSIGSMSSNELFSEIIYFVSENNFTEEI